MRAARASYEEYVGPIPAGMHVCHKCDNGLCINPDHLFVGTHLDNMADKKAKGRQAKYAPGTQPGIKHPASLVSKAKKMRAAGASFREIGDHLGVAPMTIWRWCAGVMRRGE